MLLLNTFPILLGPVGESDEVPVKEGVAIVIILDVQRGPQPRWHLVHEAEGAAIAAAAKAVEHVFCKMDAEVFSVFPVHNESEPLAGSLYFQLQPLISGVEVVIDYIPQDMTVDGNQMIPWPQAHPVRQAAFFDISYQPAAQPLTPPLLNTVPLPLRPREGCGRRELSTGRTYSSVAADRSL